MNLITKSNTASMKTADYYNCNNNNSANFHHQKRRNPGFVSVWLLIIIILSGLTFQPEPEQCQQEEDFKSIGNYFGHCRIYNYKMKTDLKTGSYPNGSTEPRWTVPDSSSATYCPYGQENKENKANLYTFGGYNITNNIILHKQKNEFTRSGKNGIDRIEKKTETCSKGLKTQYQPSDKISDLSTPKNSSSSTTNYCQNNTSLFSLGLAMTCTTVNNSNGDRSSPNYNRKDRDRSPNSKDCVSSWSSTILNKMPKIKDMKNGPVDNNNWCNERQRQQNNTPRSFTQLQKNIQEAVRNFSWWPSGYVHENLNCFNWWSRTTPYPHQNRGQHLCHRTSQSLDHYYYRPRPPLPEIRYPCQSSYIPPFCYNSPERHCPPQQPPKKEHPGFCVANNNLTVGQVSYPSSSYITKGNGRAPTKRPTTCSNKKASHISRSDWSKSRSRELFDKTHWFSETAKENYKIPSVQKVNNSAPKQIDVYSIVVNDLQPSIPSAMSPVNCDDSPLPSTLYSKHQNHQEENNEKTKIDSPEASMFSPVHWATPSNLDVDSRQMLDQVVNLNKENWLETDSVLSDDDDDDDDSSLSDMVLNNDPSSKDDIIDYVVEDREEEEEKEKSDDDDDDDKKLHVDLCPNPSSPHRKPEDEDESDDSGDESDSESGDIEVDGLTDCEVSDDDIEMDGGPVQFKLPASSKVDGLLFDDDEVSDDDLEMDGGPVQFESPASSKDYQKSGVCPIELELSIVDDLKADGGRGRPVTLFQFSICDDDDDYDETDGCPVAEFVDFDDDFQIDVGSKCVPISFEVSSSVNSWLIKPDSDCDDSDDDDDLTQDDDDDWETTWSKSSATPIVPPSEEDLMDEFNNFTLFNCSLSCDVKAADVPSAIEVDCGYSQNLKEVNERWNQIYKDQDFTPKENHHKKVQFANGKDFSIIHHMVYWNYAYRAARKGPWRSLVLDSERFRNRINELKSVIDPILDPIHRQKVYASRIQQTAEENT